MKAVIEKIYSRLKEEGLELEEKIQHSLNHPNTYETDVGTITHDGPPIPYLLLETDPDNVQDQVTISSVLKLQHAVINTKDGTRIVIDPENERFEERIRVGTASYNQRQIIEKISQEIEW